MQAPLTPERLAATYDYLRTWPPFCRWGLPVSDEIRFRTTERKDLCGQFKPDPLEIMVSTSLHWKMESLIQTMAHEVIHLHQHLAKTENRSQHNAEFKRIAKAICKQYGWDCGQFVGGV
jgi:predicted SprT family Zn-dependent metalloprotease